MSCIVPIHLPCPSGTPSQRGMCCTIIYIATVNCQLSIVNCHKSPSHLPYRIRFSLFSLRDSALHFTILLTYYTNISPCVYSLLIIKCFTIIIIQTIRAICFPIVTNFQVHFYSRFRCMKHRLHHRNDSSVFHIYRNTIQSRSYCYCLSITNICTGIKIIPITLWQYDFTLRLPLKHRRYQ